MEVSGKTVLKNKNLKLCNFCEDFDVTTYADGFCLECEVYTCDTCFQKHKGRRINRNHSLVNVDESNSVKITVDDAYETCQFHKGELVKFYCSKHDQVCCGDCIVLNHNGCKIEFINNKAAAFENSQDNKTLIKDLNKCKRQAEDSLSLVAINRQQLSKLYEQFVRDVETFAEESIERLNLMKEKVLNQGKDVMLNDKRKLDDIQKEADDLIVEISNQSSLLESKKDQPNKLFAASLQVKPALKRTQHNIDILRKKNVVTEYIFKRDQTLEEMMKESKGIGLLLQQGETESTIYTRDIDPPETVARYVKVQNIPKGLDIQSLKVVLFREGDFPVRLPKLIYCNGDSEALLICQSEKDAVDLTKCTHLKPFEFKVLEKVGKFVTKAIDQNCVEKMKQFSNFDKFQRELLYYDITIIKEPPCVIGAPTILQIKFSKLIIDKWTQIQTTENFKSKSEAHKKKDALTSDNDLSISENLSNKIGSKYLKEYITKENINVYVYEANILQLDVDCIVSASNECLQHGGGVAAVIEKGAGYRLTKESNDFVRKYGNLPVGKACTTTAGNLSYDCVIHTVGPRWSAYSPHSMQDVQDCQLHLYQAVYNSFIEAEKRGLKSIALPAISSAIFGVPEEICVQQYAKATFDYSRKTSNEPSALKEIHFIDKNTNIVKKIQDAFYLVFVKGEMPDCDTSKFVKSWRHGKGHSPGSYTGAQAGFSSSVHKDSFNAQTQSTTSNIYEVTQTEPLSFFDEESNAYAYILHGKEEYRLLLTRGDLLKVKARAIVIPVDGRGNRGNIAGSLFSRIPNIYRKNYTCKLSLECHRKKECDVFITHGYECGYPIIVHAIYPANAKYKDISQRKHDVQKLYKNVFSLCDTETGIQEVVAPLLGPDSRSESDIRACAEMFLQSYLDYYSRPVRKKSLLVHIVCREDLVFDCVKGFLDEYVMSKKAECYSSQNISS
ncbi:uncharacterized protein LOC132742311 isoform X2 [Ruditapes philippinarum]|nr:uncharacterized protein LOC132742311 isoform X2 [Ruditapes philippinarum]XP_060586662.1 uncharacterized protein LOC132742311 isoform X2 [Ruditapes philippinarum]